MLRQMMEQSEADEQHKAIERRKLEAMLGLCEIASCRRVTLLRYFGDRLDGPCGNCDNCLDPPQTWDASLAAQKAMSAVYRTGQRFGVNYLIDVLRGSTGEPRIARFGHDRLKVFGLGKEHDEGEWRSLFRQLVARGLLDVDVTGHGSLLLSEDARPFLRGEQPLYLRRDRKPERSRKTDRRDGLAAEDRSLWDALRARRMELAQQQGVPPYVIFHDAVLMQMVERRPRTLAQFSRLDGVGARKLEQYGQDFLDALQAFDAIRDRAADESRDGGSETLVETLSLVRGGLDVDAVAVQRRLASSTIWGHAAKLVGSGELDLSEVVDLPADELGRIRDVLIDCGVDARFAVRTAHDRLERAYSWGLLRCVAADLARRAQEGANSN